MVSEAETDGLWVDENQHKVVWNPSVSGGVVAEVDGGGWGNRVYSRAVPAPKSQSWGAGGRTHLIEDTRSGARAARRLHRKEVAAIFLDCNLRCHVRAGDEGIDDMCDAAPVRMYTPFTRGLVAFTKPPSDFVPAAVTDIVSSDAVTMVRGAMALAHEDFQKQVELK